MAAVNVLAAALERAKPQDAASFGNVLQGRLRRFHADLEQAVEALYFSREGNDT